MASIDPSQDYDCIHTLYFDSDYIGSSLNFKFNRGSSYSLPDIPFYYRFGESGSWVEVITNGSYHNITITDNTLQIAHDWNMDGYDYMTPSFTYSDATSIYISQKEGLSGRIGNGFFKGYAQYNHELENIDTPSTHDVTSVGDDFMRDYVSGDSLTTLYAPRTLNLTSVGNGFMFNFAQGSVLTSLSIPDTSNITSAGDYFMGDYASSTAVSTLSVPDTSKLTYVGNFFMSQYAKYCSSLTTLAVPDTSNFTSVGDSFMSEYANYCSKLPTLDAPNTSKVEYVGTSFMASYAAYCGKLTRLGVPDLGNLRYENSGLMDMYASGCRDLIRLDLPSNVNIYESSNANWGTGGWTPATEITGYTKNTAAWTPLLANGGVLQANYINWLESIPYSGFTLKLRYGGQWLNYVVEPPGAEPPGANPPEESGPT